MSTIVGTIQEIVRQELRRLHVTELGVVEAVFPHSGSGDDDNYGCDVRLKASNLLLKRVPVATGHIGTAAVPNKGDLVLLAFHQADVNQAIVVGRLYNDNDRPPLNRTDEVVFRLPLAEADSKTVKAAIRNHQDASPPREAILELPPKITFRLTDGTIRATAGHSELTLDQPDGSGGTVQIEAGGTTITLNQDGDLEISADGAISIKAAGDLTLEGQSVTITGQTSTDVGANTQLNLHASLGATLDGGLSSTVQGTSLTLQGMTSFTP
jgi:uncharacterized protein involved in type VI secretion and phage assembly